jgi:hypothetical protein
MAFFLNGQFSALRSQFVSFSILCASIQRAGYHTYTDRPSHQNPQSHPPPSGRVSTDVRMDFWASDSVSSKSQTLFDSTSTSADSDSSEQHHSSRLHLHNQKALLLSQCPFQRLDQRHLVLYWRLTRKCSVIDSIGSARLSRARDLHAGRIWGLAVVAASVSLVRSWACLSISISTRISRVVW